MMRLFSSLAWVTSTSQNAELTESGLITNRKVSECSMARRRAAGNTSASRIPSTSTHTSLPRLRSSSARRITNAPSRREYETNT
jgi:hypothetical protein